MYTVPVAWITHAIRVHGADSPDIRAGLAAARIPWGIADEAGAEIKASQFATFIEEAARVAGNDLYGLELGMQYDLRASGISAYISLACATARESLRNASRYGTISDTSAEYELTDTEDGAFFRIGTRSPRIRMSRHATEFKVAVVVKACLTWVGPTLRPQEARFSVTRADQRSAERLLGCPVHYGAEETGLAFSSEQLELRPRTSDPYLLDLLKGVASDWLARHAPAPDATRSRVERLLLDVLPKGAPAMRQVAEALGFSERTLARRLAAEGVTFGHTLDELRRDVALGYVDDPTMTFTQIAYLLGYSDQSAFTNAFRRWTGRSPRQFRAEAARK